MKKVLTILVVLTLVAGFAFATAANTVTLNTVIAAENPTYELTVNNGTAFTTEETTVNGLAAEGGVTAEFKIAQTNAAKVASGTVVTLTVTCKKFINVDDATKETALPTVTVTGEGLGNAATRTNLTFNAAAAGASNVATFTPKYSGKVASGEIGRFTANWAQNDNLPSGTYKADIELAYTGL